MFSVRLRELRRKRKLSQTDLGDMVGLSTSAISMYEQGRRGPDADTLIKFADYFGVTTDYLLGRADKPFKELDPDGIHLSNSMAKNNILKKFSDFLLRLMFQTEYAANFSDARKAKGYKTIRALSTASGISSSIIYKIENNDQVLLSPEAINKLSELLDLEPIDFLVNGGYFKTKYRYGDAYWPIIKKAFGKIIKERILELDASQIDDDTACIFQDIKTKYPKASYEQIIDIFISKIMDATVDPLLDEYNIRLGKAVQTDKGVIIDFLEEIDPQDKKLQKILTQKNFIEVPVFKCDQLSDIVLNNLDNAIDLIVMPSLSQYKDIIYVIMQDDSMSGSRIYNGDRIVVKKQSEINNNEIALIAVDFDKVIIRRVANVNDQYILYADNPQYSPLVIDKIDVEIIGKVIKVEFDPKNAQLS